jgi:GNAT superfamily N-acetyltransferase
MSLPLSPFTPFTTTIRVIIRLCRAEDLPALEWWGLFMPHRDLIRSLFARHASGTAAVMLVAEANGMAAGQAWIDTSRQPVDGTGVIWALRVFPCLQGTGIGTRLMAASEEVLRERNCRLSEVSVEVGDEALLCFYRRLNYRQVEATSLADLVPPGSPVPAEGSQRVLRKLLAEPPSTVTPDST